MKPLEFSPTGIAIAGDFRPDGPVVVYPEGCEIYYADYQNNIRFIINKEGSIMMLSRDPQFLREL